MSIVVYQDVRASLNILGQFQPAGGRGLCDVFTGWVKRDPQHSIFRFTHLGTIIICMHPYIYNIWGLVRCEEGGNENYIPRAQCDSQFLMQIPRETASECAQRTWRQTLQILDLGHLFPGTLSPSQSILKLSGMQGEPLWWKHTYIVYRCNIFWCAWKSNPLVGSGPLPADPETERNNIRHMQRQN